MCMLIGRIFLLVFVSFFLIAGCLAAQEQTATEELTLLVPKGDPAAGRADFQDLLCTACHRVTGDTRLPKPISTTKAPDLGPKQAKMPVQELAASIIMPSHKMSQDVQKSIYGKISPMTDYSDAITVKQLSNILAYIRSLK